MVRLPKKTHAIDPATGRWRADGDEFWLRFPGDPSHPLVTRKNKALQLRNELLACDSIAALQRVKQRWSVDDDGGEGWCKPVFNRVLTTHEQDRLRFLSAVQPYSDEWEEVESIPNA